MKIVVILSNNPVYNSVLSGWSNGLTGLKHNVQAFDKSAPLFRILDQVKPDILIGCLEICNNGLKKAIEEFGIKTIILTADELFEHQNIPGVNYVSWNPELNIENLIHSPPGYDDLIYYAEETTPEWNTVVICDRELTAEEELWLTSNPTYRLYGSCDKIRHPQYLGNYPRSRQFYHSIEKAYLLDEFIEIGNMVMCGVEIRTNIHDVVDVVPTPIKYIDAVKKVLETII